MAPSQNTDDDSIEMPDRETLRGSDRLVRDYSPIPAQRVWAVRSDDGSEHWVRYRDGEGRSWTRAVPAERTHVHPDERLWTVPDNWEQRLQINGNGNRQWGIWHIPDAGVDVKLTHPQNNHVADAWNGVKAVGELTVTWDGAWDWEALDDVLAEARERDDLDPHVVESLETLEHRQSMTERVYGRKRVDPYAEEALFDTVGDPGRMDGWTFGNWEVGWEESISDTLYDVLTVDRDTASELASLLRVTVVSPHPSVRVAVDDSDVTDEYWLRALVQSGCSPPQAVDYLMCETHDMTQAAWAAERGVQQPSVSDNIAQAERTLTE